MLARVSLNQLANEFPSIILKYCTPLKIASNSDLKIAFAFRLDAGSSNPILTIFFP
jgi:hypothetical protein